MKYLWTGWMTCLYLCVCIAAYADKTNTLDSHLQQTLDHYLANQGKGEGVTGIAASVSYADPLNKKETIKTLVTGLRGFPPHNQPVTMNNLYEIGSITKSFTSALILQLQAAGKLSINDKIGRWLPQYPNWKDVTIKQLLNMTSNIPSYTTNNKFIDKVYHNFRTELTNAELLDYAHPEEPLSKQTRFDYSNTNYVLAGLIIEAITGHPFAKVLQQKLFDQPYHLKNTYYVAGRDWKKIRADIMPRMVHGYFYDTKTKKMVDATNSNLSWAGPAGGIVSDTQDMMTWIKVLYHGFFVEPKARETTLADLESVVSMRTGKAIPTVTATDPMGYGLGVGYLYHNDKQGRFWVYKGSGMGFRMMYLWHPCNDVSVVAVLNNKAGEADPAKMGGDHIEELIFNLYDNIVKAWPSLNCKT